MSTALPVLPNAAAANSSSEAGDIKHLKPPVDESTLTHRDLLRGPFWQKIPAYREISEETFLDHSWQSKHSIVNPEKLLEAVKGLVSDDFIADARVGFHKAPMSVRVSPYLLSLIDWQNP